MSESKPHTNTGIPGRGDGGSIGTKRDSEGNRKAPRQPKKKHGEEEDGSKSVAPPNAYTAMFEGFRAELDKHHDRRSKIDKVARDVTNVSKKIIFALQRVRKLHAPLPVRFSTEIAERTSEIRALLATIADDVSGIRRHRYAHQLRCLEEFVEAATFAHYLTTGTLMSPAEAQSALDRGFEVGEDGVKQEEGSVGQNSLVTITHPDYVLGLFDLTGEMMRFATSVTALTGAVPSISPSKGQVEDRSIVGDLQMISSILQILPRLPSKGYDRKVDVMTEQVKKVERLAYGVKVRGNERPKGWMPDTTTTIEDGGTG